MKISPVQGTPTLPSNPTRTLSTEKLERLKSIAEGKAPEEKPAEPEPRVDTTPRIKMDVNKTPESAQATEPATQEVSNPDIDVQTKSEPEAIKPISPQLAELARQRRALQAKERELAEKEKALKGQTVDSLVQRLQSQPLSVLQEYGVTYDKLTEDILASQQGNTEVATLKAKIAELEKSIDERFTKKDTEQEQAVFNHIKQNVDSLSFSSDDYKFIRESKSQGDVVELIKSAWFEKGQILDEEEAMKLIESELREDARKYAKMIGELEKPAQAPVEPQPAPVKTESPGLKTITNKDAARPPMSRRQRAIAAMLGQK